MKYIFIFSALLLIIGGCSKATNQKEASFDNSTLINIKSNDNVWFNKNVSFTKSSAITIFVDNKLNGSDGSSVGQQIVQALPIAVRYLNNLTPNIKINSVSWGDSVPALGTSYSIVIRGDNSGASSAPAFAHIPAGNGNTGDLISINKDCNQSFLSWIHVYYTRLLVHEMLHTLGYAHTGAVSYGDYDANAGEMAVPNPNQTPQNADSSIMESYHAFPSLIGYGGGPADFDTGANPYYIFTKGDLSMLNWYYKLSPPYNIY